MKVFNRINPVMAGLLAAVLVVAALVVFWPGADTKTVTADFPRQRLALRKART